MVISTLTTACGDYNSGFASCSTAYTCTSYIQRMITILPPLKLSGENPDNNIVCAVSSAPPPLLYATL